LGSYGLETTKKFNPLYRVLLIEFLALACQPQTLEGPIKVSTDADFRLISIKRNKEFPLGIQTLGQVA